MGEVRSLSSVGSLEMETQVLVMSSGKVHFSSSVSDIHKLHVHFTWCKYSLSQLNGGAPSADMRGEDLMVNECTTAVEDVGGRKSQHRSHQWTAGMAVRTQQGLANDHRTACGSTLYFP
jgi:hypothetical protein